MHGRGGGGGGRVTLVAIHFAKLCARNYSWARFIAPGRYQITSPSPAPCPTGDWEGELHGSGGSRTSWLRLWISICLISCNFLAFLSIPPSITCIYTVMLQYWNTIQSYISTFSIIFKRNQEKPAKIFITMFILIFIFHPVLYKPTWPFENFLLYTTVDFVLCLPKVRKTHGLSVKRQPHHKFLIHGLETFSGD